MIVKLLTEHHLEFLSLKGGCTGSSESTLVKCHFVGSHITLLKYASVQYLSTVIVLICPVQMSNGGPAHEILVTLSHCQAASG